MAAKKRVAKPKLEAVPEPKIAKGPTTRSGTLSATDRKPAAAPAAAKPKPKAKVAPVVLADPELGPGLVEHGVGLGRHRPEDGPVPAEGTVILVAPERGA